MLCNEKNYALPGVISNHMSSNNYISWSVNVKEPALYSKGYPCRSNQEEPVHSI